MAKKKRPADHLTVGHLRRVIADLPDDLPIAPEWYTIPNKRGPGVELVDIEARHQLGFPVLAFRVRLFELR